ncbi:hypothetical protein Leryth_006494 [Lithospermum erythrorhizon]|nr:hypothetical protein Leryth_006494 [Lithospermum erythrorhizon]
MLFSPFIAGYLENKLLSDAFQLFQSMVKGPIQPNCATIASILPICDCLAETDSYKLGKQIHCYVLQRADLFSEITVMNALLSFYLRFGETKEAESLFRKMKFKDLVSWNSLIAGYVSNGKWLKAVGLFDELLNFQLIRPGSVTLISTLSACGSLLHLNLGKQIHGFVIRNRCLQEDSKVQNALISFYAKCGYTKTALQTFLSTPVRDLISWNAILDACKENQFDDEFFDLLQWMSREGIRPDSITLLTIIQFCATQARADFVKAAHAFLIRSSYSVNNGEPTLVNALMDAYAKCGLIVYASNMFKNFVAETNVETSNLILSRRMDCGLSGDAHSRFERTSYKDITTWNFMVQGYAANDLPDHALSMFQQLQCNGMKPDNMSIMNVLPVCVQMSSIDMLKQCHGYVFRSCFEDVHLNAALIDAYSKCGSLDSAYKLFQAIQEKDLVMFTAMVGGYAMHGMGIEALETYYNMLEFGLHPDNVLMTTVLFACSHAGFVEKGLEIFDSIEKVHKMKPSMEQYACLVDLLARGGRLKDAYHFVNKMPIEANATIWGALLGGCKTHDDVNMCNIVAEHLIQVQSTDIGNYVEISNMYAANARWDGVLEMRKLMRTIDPKKPPGCSWIEVDRTKMSFVAGGFNHLQNNVITRTIRALDQHIRDQPLRLTNIM